MPEQFSTSDASKRIHAEFGIHVPPWKIRLIFGRELPEVPRVAGRRLLDETIYSDLVSLLVVRGTLPKLSGVKQ